VGRVDPLKIFNRKVEEVEEVEKGKKTSYAFSLPSILLRLLRLCGFIIS
jgi:hypothetical protein